ncbi:MAG: tetratricopeptide repeat protein [Deltaproteobacteria bacterium]|nr:tetratricopeptide repeat protein [Deltaproteobacteria bacterium]
MVNVAKFWIEGVLTVAYPDFSKTGGIDLDGNGVIEGNEVFGDLNGNGIVGDRDDYKTYLRNNRPALSAKIPFLKWGERLSVDNRIHQLMYWLSDLHSDALMQSAYLFIADRVADANKTLGPQHHLPPEQESPIYYQLIKGAGIVFESQKDPSLITNIASRQLDCDTSSFVAMAMGDERGVTLQAVKAPEHLFLRGKREDGGEFNVDFGDLTSNEEYLRPPYNVTPEQIQNEVYLQTLDDKQLENEFLIMRGIVLGELNRNKEALAAYDRAIAIDPNFASAHSNRGNALSELGRNKEALAAYDRAIAIDPNFTLAHSNRGVVLRELNRNKEALATYDRAIAIDPNFAFAHFNRGNALSGLGRNKEALDAYDRAIAIDPNFASAHFNRGNALSGLGRREEALAAFKRAHELDLRPHF